MAFLEFGVREIVNSTCGCEGGIVARFLLRSDRDEYIAKENADRKKRNASYRYVPVRFRRPNGDR